MKQWNTLKEKLCDIESTLKALLGLRNTFGDHISIKDEVLVYQGDKLLFKSKGHIVNQGLIGIINLMACGTMPTSDSMPSNTFPTTYVKSTMRVGTGGGVTVSSTTALTTEVATAPNSQSGATASPAVGTYRASWLATWNAGTLAAITITELGLKLNIKETLQVFGAGLTANPNMLFSRLSDADGDFVAFLVNILVPLTVEWRLTFTFA